MNVAVILAGGLGKRMDHRLPKQFLEIAGKPILLTTLEVFASTPEVGAIVLVVPKDWRERVKKVLQKNNFRQDIKVIPGGSTRQESSFLALRYCQQILKMSEEDIIVVHDAVRPFVKVMEIEKGIELAKKFGASTGAVKTTDAVVEAKEFISNIPDKNSVYLTRSPDVFQLGLGQYAHEKALVENISDAPSDYSLIFRCNHQIKLFTVSYDNIKITTPADIKLAEKIINERKNAEGGS